MSTKAELQLHSALLKTGLVQPVETSMKGGRVEVLCRQVPGQEKPWLKVVERLLKATDGKDYRLLIARRYLLKQGQMVFGWHIGVEAKSAKQALQAIEGDLGSVLDQAKPSLITTRVEQEAPAQVPTRQPAPPSAAQKRRDSPLPYAHLTDSRPRALEPVADPVIPQGRPVPKIRLIKKSVEGGRLEEIQEMPLPHVYGELNKPTQAVWSDEHGRYIGGGRGAKNYAGK